MALEHALLVSLSEQPAAGLELSRRFAKSIGFFWSASHQQIYRTLARMEADGWVTATEVPQAGRPDKKVYDVSPAGRAVLADWLAAPAAQSPLRSELAVKMRGAAYGDRAAVLEGVRAHLADHHLRLAHYEQLAKRQFPQVHESGAATLTGHDLDTWLVLRGGIVMEQAWIDWLTEYVTAHESAAGLETVAAQPPRPTTPERQHP